MPGTIAGHRGLHVAGAGHRREGGCAERHLQLRRDAVRDGDRRARVRGRDPTADTLSAVLRAQPKPPTAIVPGVPSDLEKVDPALLAERSRAAVPAHGRREGRAAGDQGGVRIRDPPAAVPSRAGVALGDRALAAVVLVVVAARLAALTSGRR